MKTITKLWILIAALAILSPLGLFLPEHFKAGAAWGEWGSEEIRALVGYIPQGLEKFSSLWTSAIPDYVFRGWEGKPLRFLSVAYIISAIAGIAATVGAIFFIGKFFTKKDQA